MSTDTSTKLNRYNFLNLVAFGMSFVLNYTEEGPENEGNWFNGMSSLFRRYESLMTPADTTFILTKVILIFEGVFAIVQLLPNYRGNHLVQQCVKHWYFVLAFTQLLWSLDLNIENIWGSVVSTLFIGVMFAAVSMILVSQAKATDPATQTREEYWLLRFPFNVHCGFIMANFIASINGMFVQIGFGALAQFIVGFISLAIFVLAGYKFLFRNGLHGNYVIPSVLAFYAIEIAMDDFGPMMDQNLEGITGEIFMWLSGIIGVGMFIVMAITYYRTEYIPSKEAKSSQSMNPKDESEDTVYVTAPDGGSMA